MPSLLPCTVGERVDGTCRALELTGETKRCLNLGSYNYLGFAASDPYCTPQVLECLDRLGWSACSSRAEAGAPLPPSPRIASPAAAD